MNTPARFLKDLIDGCVLEREESMKYEGRMMKWSSLSGAFSSFIIQPSSLPSLLRLTADSPDLLAVIKLEGRV